MTGLMMVIFEELQRLEEMAGRLDNETVTKFFKKERNVEISNYKPVRLLSLARFLKGTNEQIALHVF